MHSLSVIEPLVRDLRYAIRMLRKTPGFTVIAVVTLAVGIGVNTAVFSVVNGLLLRPLPYPDADRLATVRMSGHGPRGDFSNDAIVDGALFLAIRDNSTTVDVAVKGGSFGDGVNLFAQHHAASVVQARVSAGYFGVLGVRPLLGREFTAEEDRPGGAAVAVLSHSLWARVFRSDPVMVGTSILLRGQPYTVVGIMPSGFTDGGRTEVWTPIRPSTIGEGGGTNYHLIARLHTGTAWSQASAEVTQLTTHLFTRQAANGTSVVCSLIPLQTGNTSDIRDALLLLWGAVGVVLLIACVNVAGLLLARSGMRAREIATRMMLGSGRAVVVRQFLVESAVLALLGGIAGVGLGWLALESVKSLSADVFDFGYPITLDGRVLTVSLIVALGTSVLFGLVPALHASRVDVQGALAEAGTRSVAGAAGGWSRRALVVGEVAMGVVLLVSAGLLVRTFVQLKGLSPGFDASGVMTATISLQDARYEDPVRVARLFEDSLSRIRSAPGVQAAGVTLGLPYTRLLNLGFRALDGTVDPDMAKIANVAYITPGYFEALKVRVMHGRAVSDADRADSLPVAVVNEEFARRYYGDTEAVGRHIGVILRGERREIVGIVANTRTTTSGYQGYSDPLVAPPIIYVPAAQLNADIVKLVHTWFSPSWVVRGSRSNDGTGEGISAAIAAVDPMLPISKLDSMSAVVSASLAPQRFMMSLVLGLGAVAVLLAAIGIHGLIGSSVAERTRELGIRLALGATGPQVLRDVLLPGVMLAAIGVIIGAGLALATARLMRSYIWGVTATDPVTFAAVIAGLLAIAAVASFIPARRVLRLDPALTLRAD